MASGAAARGSVPQDQLDLLWSTGVDNVERFTPALNIELTIATSTLGTDLAKAYPPHSGGGVFARRLCELPEWEGYAQETTEPVLGPEPPAPWFFENLKLSDAKLLAPVILGGATALIDYTGAVGGFAARLMRRNPDEKKAMIRGTFEEVKKRIEQARKDESARKKIRDRLKLERDANNPKNVKEVFTLQLRDWLMKAVRWVQDGSRDEDEEGEKGRTSKQKRQASGSSSRGRGRGGRGGRGSAGGRSGTGGARGTGSSRKDEQKKQPTPKFRFIPE
jgi:uncharacterized membrane protein YgcG